MYLLKVQVIKKINILIIAEKDILELHIAHNEGNYFCSSDELIKKLEDNNQIAVTYCDEKGNKMKKTNPGIMELLIILQVYLIKNKNILGMMPHPERMIDKYLSGD